MTENNQICTTETRLTIYDIPIKIISDILELIEPIYRHAIRKVSRSLRAAVDAKTSGIKVLSFWMGSPQDFRLFFDGFHVRYTQNDSDCILKWGTFETNEKVIRGGDAAQIAFNDFGRLLTSELKHLTVWLGEEDDEFRKKTFQSLKDVLNSVRYIDAKKLTLNSFSAEEMAQLMSNFKEGSLQDIVINPTKDLDKFAEIVQLRQWKHARTFLWDNSRGKFHSDMVPIEHFFHFERFSVNYHNFSMEDAFKVRDILLKTDHFNDCFIEFLSTDVFEIAKIFQPEYSGDHQKVYIEYEVNNSKFEIKIDSDHIWIGKL